MTSARTIDRRNAHAQPTTSAFMPGVGYVAMGLLRAAPDPIYPAERCMPPDVEAAEDGSLHELYSPGEYKTVVMVWNSNSRVWQVLPQLMASANRLGFEPRYLASYGWTYKGRAA